MNRIFFVSLGAAACGLFTIINPAFAQGTAFTYQGQLQSAGSPANGNYDFTFALFNTNSTNGGQAGTTLTDLNVGVTNGLFTVTLDFGPVFTGSNTWLSIGVQPHGGSGFTALNPLQQLTPAPYAIYAPNSGTAANVTGAISLSQLPGAVLTNNATNVNLGGTFAGNGAGVTNVPGTTPWQTVAGTNVNAAPDQAYLLTNNVGSSVTLPAAPIVGDIVTVSGVGSNSWQALPGFGQNIAGYTLPAGATWAASSSGTNNWGRLAASADGTKLVAASSPGYIYTSVNSGTNWTLQTGSGTNNWQSVASSSDGTKLAAGVYFGQIYTSTNSGTNWTTHAAINDWTAIASSADGTHLAAAAYQGQIYTSVDSGATWTPQSSGTPSWQCLASSADGTHLVAGANPGYIYTSVNSGTNWTQQASAPSGDWTSVASSSDGTKLAAVWEGGQIYTSTNSGTNWTPQPSAPSGNWTSVASSADGTKLVASIINGIIYFSTNSGVTWTASSSVRQNWVGVSSSSDGTKLAASATVNETIYTSDPQTLPFTGIPDTTAAFQYLGGGVWQTVEQSFSQIAGSISVAQLPGSVVTNAETGVTLSGTFSGNGGGLTNLTAPSLTGALPAISGVSLTSLPANAALLNASQTFTGQNNFLSNVGIGTNAPGEILEAAGSDSTIRVRNVNDPVGGFIGDTYFTLQLGMYNPTATNQPSLSAGEKRSYFGMSYVSGVVGSLSGDFGPPTFRNILDDGSGNLSVSGKLGVGVGTTHAQLDVENSSGSYDLTSVNKEFTSTSGTTLGTLSANTSATASIYAAGDIVTAGKFIATSDERVKNIEGRSDTARDLATLRGIAITDFRYKDVIAHGDSPQKKVIAQQVETVYPQAVSRSTDVLPDIFKKATVRNGWVQLATTLKVGERVKLIGGKEAGVHEVLEVREGAFRTDFKPATDKVFVYGREVKDFRAVDYEAISMLNVSATQELAKQSELNAAKVEKLEKEIGDLKRLVVQLGQPGKNARIAADRAVPTQDALATVRLDH